MNTKQGPRVGWVLLLGRVDRLSLPPKSRSPEIISNSDPNILRQIWDKNLLFCLLKSFPFWEDGGGGGRVSIPNSWGLIMGFSYGCCVYTVTRGKTRDKTHTDFRFPNIEIIFEMEHLNLKSYAQWVEKEVLLN